MLDGADQNAASNGARKRQMVGFRAAAGEDYGAARRQPDDFGDVRPRFLDAAARLPPSGMDRGWIAGSA
jgi:hypothetical protein